MAQVRTSHWSRVSGSTTLLGALVLALAIGLLTPQITAASAAGARDSVWGQTTSKAKDGPVELSGVARPGDRVRVFQGETQLGETVAGADGKWQLTVPALTPGQRDLRVQILPSTAAPESRGGIPPGPGATPQPGETVTILISVVASGQRVTVTVVVNSPNGEVSVVVSVPVECTSTCESCPQVCDDKCEWCAQSYTVRWGDTLAKIARRYGTTASVLAKLNGLWNPNLIFPGQKLCVRGS
jgi:nucleoid-associated protein YgaU